MNWHHFQWWMNCADCLKLPAPPAKSDAEKAAEAEKTKLGAAKEADLLGKYQDSSVANYKKNKGIVDKPAAKDVAKKK